MYLDIYGFKQPEKVNYLEEWETITKTKIDPDKSIICLLEAKPHKLVYKVVRVYTFVDALAKVGSLYTSLTVLGHIIVAIFSYRLLFSNLIGQLYHFRPKFKNEIAQK